MSNIKYGVGILACFSNSVYAEESGKMLPSAKYLAEQTMQVGKATRFSEGDYERCHIWDPKPQTRYIAIAKAFAREYYVEVCDVGNNGLDSLDTLNITSVDFVDDPLNYWDNVAVFDLGLDGEISWPGDLFSLGAKTYKDGSVTYKKGDEKIHIPWPEAPRFIQQIKQDYRHLSSALEIVQEQK